MSSESGRRGFRDWIDRQEDPEWEFLPLTHVTKAIVAEDIIHAGAIAPQKCGRFNEDIAYLFYGRPAYRCNGDDVIKLQGACPVCFILDGKILSQAAIVFPFDSGAFFARLYKHVFLDEMDINDFALGSDSSRLNKLIRAIFKTRKGYFDGNRAIIPKSDDAAESWDYLAEAYLELLASPGRNEPDDRIATIEVLFKEAIPLEGLLLAIVVPHTHWRHDGKSPWLVKLEERGVVILPYSFVPGRHPEFYQLELEKAVREFYEQRNIL